MKRAVLKTLISVAGLVLISVSSLLAQEDSYFDRRYKEDLEKDLLGKALLIEPNKTVVDHFVYKSGGKNDNEANDVTIALPKENILIIKALGLPSSGYTWTIEGLDESMLELVVKKNEPGYGFGSESHNRFVFKGLKSGVTEFRIVYQRPWIKEEIKSYNIKVVSDGKYSGTFQYTNPKKTVRTIPEQKKTTNNLPSSFDWRDEFTLTPVEDQDGTNGCWAFAGTGTFESIIKIATGETVDLSEQWLANCNTYGFSLADGGWFPHKMYVEKGAVYESDAPWQGVDGTCTDDYTYREKADGWGYTDGISDTPKPAKDHKATIEQIKTAVYTYGPISANCYVGNGWYDYGGGVYSIDDGSGGHIVTIVGWDDSQSCWIIKNTWGKHWGMEGYMKINYYLESVEMGEFSVYLDFDLDQNIAPISNFVANHELINPGDEVEFTEIVIGATNSYKWTFEGGDPASSTAKNPKVVYNTPGKYSVTLEATNQYGSSTETKEDFIFVDEYCVAQAIPSSSGDYITKVNLGSIIASSSNDGYSYNTQISTNIISNNEYTISVKLNNVLTNDNVFAWIDWNIDKTFSEDETIELTESESISKTFEKTFTAPSDLVPGDSRMRVRVVRESGGGTAQPCGEYYGEIEDYNVKLQLTTDVNEISESNPFKVYPVPSGSELNIEFDEFTQGKIFLYKMNGALYHQENFSSSFVKINLENYPTGIYHLKIINADNVYTEKIIVK